MHIPLLGGPPAALQPGRRPARAARVYVQVYYKYKKIQKKQKSKNTKMQKIPNKKQKSKIQCINRK